MQTNCLEDLTIKITDFGFAKVIDPACGLSDILGSPVYMAPEIVFHKTYGILRTYGLQGYFFTSW